MLENQHRPVSNLFYPVMTQEASLPDKRPENVAGLRCPPLDEVRIGLIGAGSRGTGLLRRLIRIEGRRHKGGIGCLRREHRRCC